MTYILLGFSVAGLSVCAFFMFFDQGRWLPAFARRDQEKPTKDLFTWTDQVDSAATDADETRAQEIGRGERLDIILETKFTPLNDGETGGADLRFQWGQYTLRELEANFAAEIPSPKNEPRRARLR